MDKGSRRETPGHNAELVIFHKLTIYFGVVVLNIDAAVRSPKKHFEGPL